MRNIISLLLFVHFCTTTSYAQKYKDPSAFDLKGPIRSCITTHQAGNKDTIYFTKDGALIDKNVKVQRDRNGRPLLIIKETDYSGLINFFGILSGNYTAEPVIQKDTTRYVYNINGSLSAVDRSLSNTRYARNKNDDIIAETTHASLLGFDHYDYEIINKDVYGNWTKRKTINSDKSDGIEIREITYWTGSNSLMENSYNKSKVYQLDYKYEYALSCNIQKYKNGKELIHDHKETFFLSFFTTVLGGGLRLQNEEGSVKIKDFSTTFSGNLTYTVDDEPTYYNAYFEFDDSNFIDFSSLYNRNDHISPDNLLKTKDPKDFDAKMTIHYSDDIRIVCKIESLARWENKTNGYTSIVPWKDFEDEIYRIGNNMNIAYKNREYRSSKERLKTGTIANAIDLGLSVKWASHNIGAKKAENIGGKYGWGDPNGDKNSENNNDYPSANPPTNISGTEYDIAKKTWGGQ